MTNDPKKEHDKEKTRDEIRMMFQKAAEAKKPVARDMVELEHVETKKQKVSEEAMRLAKTLKDKVLEHDGFEELSNDELTILESFGGKPLFLSRIAIIANQSRIPLGKPGFTKAELEGLLEGLIKRGYVESREAPGGTVFLLTERGKYRIQ